MDCANCHAGRFDHGDGPNCENCHSLDWGHVGTPSQIHVPAVVTNCTPCHDASLTIEHNTAGRTTSTGAAIVCDTCHTSTDPNVVNAIATNNSACSACHTGGIHPDAHVSTVGSTALGTTGQVCADCHEHRRSGRSTPRRARR